MSAFAALTPAQQVTLLEGPALTPPPGIRPNLDDPPNRNVLTYGVLFTCAGFAAIIVAVRLYAKAFCNRRVDVEDYLAIAALAVYGVFLYGSYEMVHVVGSFNHQWNVRLKDMSGFLYNMNIVSVSWTVAVNLLKASILLEWVHTFVPKGLRNAFFWTCWVIIVINTLANVALAFVEIFACSPRERYWDRVTVEGKCVNEYAVYVISCVVNTFVDVIILVLPQRVIWTLRVSTRKQIGISLIFMIGVLACACGALRLVFVIRFFQTDDRTYAITPVGLLAWGEITSGFLVLCMPSIPKAFRNTPWIQKLVSSIKSRLGSGESQDKNVGPRYYFQSWHRRPRVGARDPLDTDLSMLSQSDLITNRISITSKAESSKEKPCNESSEIGSELPSNQTPVPASHVKCIAAQMDSRH